MMRFLKILTLYTCLVTVAAAQTFSHLEAKEGSLEFLQNIRSSNFGQPQRPGDSEDIQLYSFQSPLLGKFSFRLYANTQLNSHFNDHSLRLYNQEFEVSPSPGIEFEFTGASLGFHRKGLRFKPRTAPFFLDVKYRNLNRFAKSMPVPQSSQTRLKALSIEMSIDF